MWARLKNSLASVGALSARRGKWGIISWHVSADADARDLPQRLRAERSRYHLGRARLARDAGHPEAGVQEARRALALTPANPWALAVLGQCLLRQSSPDVAAARRVTEQAWALDPTNGYFVRLLLDVLDAQGDIVARAELLDWAWWKGAPVERWLPDGAPHLAVADRLSRDVDDALPATAPAAPTEQRETVPV
jgi:tetratricopeptide (TPR) repeat protein